MKWPWTKFEIKTASAIVNLKMMLDKKIVDSAMSTHETTMAQINILKRSDQIKHNRLNQRLIALETCFKDNLEAYYKRLDQLEIDAAKDAEK